MRLHAPGCAVWIFTVTLVPASIPLPLQADLDVFARHLSEKGLRAALLYLNRRTPHRFTGVFRLDDDMLRSVALVDKWDPAVEHGDDVPLASAYCAHLHRTGETLEVEQGATDPRVPWMHDSPIVSYCGSVIVDKAGAPWGALCHFDTARCDAKNSDMPLLIAAARIIYDAAAVVT